MFINRFTGQPFLPRFNVPEVFGEALSYEDQIIWLAKHFKKLYDYVSAIDLDRFRTEVLAAVAKQLAGYQATTDARLAAMERKIDAYVSGDLIYDPTQGAYVPSMVAMRRVYAALVHSGNSHVYDASQLTVDGLAGKNAHAYSVAGLAEVDWTNEIGATDPAAPGTEEE